MATAEPAPPSLSVLVNNIPFGTRPSELEDFFRPCGSVTDVHIPSDRRTGRPKGFAFVRFGEQQHADRALDLSGKDFGGRVIGVHYAKRKQT
jgi:RNA recognition motif-containing protein